MSVLDTIPVQTTRDRVYQNLQAAIFTGKLRLGETLRENNLSAQLGVSRPVIREALQGLAERGLIEQSPYRSTRVFWLSPDECDQLVDLRALLECTALAQAAGKAGSGVGALRNAAIALEDARRSKDYLEFLNLDIGFHRLIWDLAGNRPLARLLETVCTQVFAIFSQLRHLEGAQYPQDQYSHSELVEALERGDSVEQLQEWMKNHVTYKWRAATGYGHRYAQMFGSKPGEKR